MIKNLQYGNLYKFQVSLGLVLFLFPFFFTYLLWTSDCGLFISHEEYLKYSPEVRKLFDNKLNIFIFLNTSSITVLFFCFFSFPLYLQDIICFLFRGSHKTFGYLFLVFCSMRGESPFMFC